MSLPSLTEQALDPSATDRVTVSMSFDSYTKLLRRTRLRLAYTAAAFGGAGLAAGAMLLLLFLPKAPIWAPWAVFIPTCVLMLFVGYRIMRLNTDECEAIPVTFTVTDQ